MRVILTGPTGIMFQAPASAGAIREGLDYLTNNFDRTNAVRYRSSNSRFAFEREYYETLRVEHSDGRISEYNLLIVR